MRRTLTALHRWLGLFTAVFLFIAGFTGAIISWEHELDALLNPELYRLQPKAATGQMSSLELADQIEAQDPQARVRFLPLAVEPGETLQLSVLPRIDPATHEPYSLEYNQVAVDPRTGDVQGKRMWGAVSLARANLLPFLYRLHYTLHLPDVFGVETGTAFMGIVGVVWVLDNVASLAISFPSRKIWRRSFAFRWKQGGHRLVFDLHRSGGVWLWLLLLTVAITSVSMNLGDEVVRPVVSMVSPLTPNVFDGAPREARASEPEISRAHAVELARAEAAKRGWTAPAGGVFYDSEARLYGVGFYEPENDHGDSGLGNPWLYFKSDDGAYKGQDVPGEGSAGDIFMAAQFPIHSGRIFGLAGRIAISCLGVLIATLSATGILIWLRRRRRRTAARPSHSAAA